RKIPPPRSAASRTGNASTRSPSQFGMRTRSGPFRPGAFPGGGAALAEDAEAPAHIAEDVEGAVQLLLGVRRGHDRAQPRAALGDRRIADPLGKHALLEKAIRELHREI